MGSDNHIITKLRKVHLRDPVLLYAFYNYLSGNLFSKWKR